MSRLRRLPIAYRREAGGYCLLAVLDTSLHDNLGPEHGVLKKKQNKDNDTILYLTSLYTRTLSAIVMFLT